MQDQATEKIYGHLWLVVYRGSAFPVSQSQFLQRSTHSSLCAGCRGNAVYVFVIKCENTSVGEDFKELCLCAFSLEPGALRSAGRLTKTDLRLTSTLQFLTNERIFASVRISLVCICCCVLLVCEVLWKRHVLLKRKKVKERKQRNRNVGRKETFIVKFLGIGFIWNLRMLTLLWKRSQGHNRCTKHCRFLLASKAWTSLAKASTYCCSFWTTVWDFCFITISFLASAHHTDQTSWSSRFLE